MARPKSSPERRAAMKPLPISTAAEHATVMKRIEELFDAKPGSEEARELEALAVFVERYEAASIPQAAPLEAISFRMKQMNLKPKDLEPFIGSRSRVHEVLKGERPLSVDMMRALNHHLGIPAEALLGKPPSPTTETIAEPSRRALAQLAKTNLRKANESFLDFVIRGFGPSWRPAMLRASRTERTSAKTDAAALQGWCAAALILSREIKVPKKSSHQSYDRDLAREIAKLSAHHDGIKKVGAFLAERGIALVILEHLPGTYLDGAAMRRDDGTYVIALTLRYDRIDNFWFTLLHEFAHVACHLNEDTSMILDDLELRSDQSIEEEADEFAQRALIPDEYCRSLKRADLELKDIQRIARQAGVHPAIVAGRWQREHGDYRKFSKFVGHGEVRYNFE